VTYMDRSLAQDQFQNDNVAEEVFVHIGLVEAVLEDRLDLEKDKVDDPHGLAAASTEAVVVIALALEVLVLVLVGIHLALLHSWRDTRHLAGACVVVVVAHLACSKLGSSWFVFGLDWQAMGQMGEPRKSS
jgi:hypothetical protein